MTKKRQFLCSSLKVHLHGKNNVHFIGSDNVYIAISSLAVCFSVLAESGQSAETSFDMEQRACPQPAAFLSQHTCITPSTYIYTSFISDWVLAISVAVGKMPRQTYCLIAWCTGHILHGHVAIITKLSPHYILIESTISGP